MSVFQFLFASALLIIAALLVAILIFNLINYFRGYAPSLSSNKEAIKNILEIYEFTPGLTIADYGAGYGNVLFALKNFPVKLTGYEINPILYAFLKLRFLGNKNIKISNKNFLKESHGKHDVIIIYGIRDVMEKLEYRLLKDDAKSITVISNKFPFKTIEHKAKMGEVYLYKL